MYQQMDAKINTTKYEFSCLLENGETAPNISSYNIKRGFGHQKSEKHEYGVDIKSLPEKGI